MQVECDQVHQPLRTNLVPFPLRTFEPVLEEFHKIPTGRQIQNQFMSTIWIDGIKDESQESEREKQKVKQSNLKLPRPKIIISLTIA